MTGRTGSLRDFVRNVIVNGVRGGPSPSSQILDADSWAYIEDIISAQIPASTRQAGLTQSANTIRQQRGRGAFSASPFPHDSKHELRRLPCAVRRFRRSSAARYRLRRPLLKTPTLGERRCSVPRPIFMIGRFDDYPQVIDYFNRDLRSCISTPRIAPTWRPI